jgi:ABC-type multidrug transport system fused ATPase/permease subunit
VIQRQVGKDNTVENKESSEPTRRQSTILPKYVIDASSKEGLRLPSVSGTIQFNNVTFAYPTRKETNVLNGFSLNVEAGTTVALVGPR